MAETEHSATRAHDASPARELVVCAHVGEQYWELHGAQGQLEAEGVIPAAIAWPVADRAADTAAVKWIAGSLQFRLQRARPDGVKGPRRHWAGCDWWRLSCSPVGGAMDWRYQRVAEARRELAQALHDLTPAGQHAALLQFQRSCAAQQDQAFQTFNALVLRLTAAQRGRRAGWAAR